MKILLIGAQGMLGRDLQAVLSVRHEVVGRDIHDLDITDPAGVEAEVGNLRPDAVINLAALTDVDGCESRREQAFSVNARGAGNVARASEGAGALLVHLSTDYVFDGNSPVPYKEEDSPGPLSIYGQSKLQGELAVQAAGENHLIVRTAWLYGRHGKNFVDTILRLASQQEELRVVDDQKGSPTFTRDLSGAIARLLEVKAGGIVHVTNSGSCTWFEFARRILAMKPPAGHRVRVTPISSSELNRPARRPAFSTLDCSRYGKLTGGEMRNWEEGLREYLA